MPVSTEFFPHSYFPGAAMAEERIPFQFLDADHLIAFVDREQPLILGTDYAILGDGRTSSGKIKALRIFGDDEKVVVTRATPRAQKAVTDPFKPLPADQIGRELDRRALIEQEIDAESVRSMRVPEGERGGTVPPLAERAGLLPVFSADGGMTAVHSFTPASGNVLDGGLWDPDGAVLDMGEWGAVPSPLPVEGGIDVARSRISMPRDLYGESAMVALGNGEYLWDNFNKVLRLGDGERPGGWEFVPNAGARTRSLFDFMTKSQILDVTSGDPQLDVADCFQALVDFCHARGLVAHIPQIHARLGKRITSLTSVTITCDSDGILEWDDLDDCGWRVTGVGMGERPGYCTVDLPQIIGPNPYQNMEFGGNKVYTAVNNVGVGFQADSLIWSNFRIQQMKGWGTGLKVMGGAVPTDNNSFEVGTIDLCKYGLMIECPAGATAAIGQSRFRTMNIMSLFPLYLKAAAGTPGIFECDVEVLGLTCPEVGGTTIYFDGSDISDCRIRGKARNGYAPNDSPVGTPTDYRGPIVGGSGSQAGESGWAVGTRNHLTLHLDEYEPASGGPIAIKARGPGTHVEISAPKTAASNPYDVITLPTTSGEAGYNGGVGGASVHEVVRVLMQVPALASGASANFYFYHQRLNADNIVPLEIVQVDNLNDLQIYTRNNGPTVKREGVITVRNATGVTKAAQDINLWLRVR